MRSDNRRRWVALGMVVLTALLGVPLTAPPAAAAAPNYAPLAGSGSTWSQPALDAWRRNVVQNGMSVQYTGLGSTTGRNQFRNNSVDFAASDIPYGVTDGTITDTPPTDRPFVYMPDTAGGTTFMYNLNIGTHRVTNLRLSGAVITGIFTGTITKWNDPKIAADNPGLTLPAIRVVPVVRSDGSGATAQFTQWMIATNGGAWTAYCGKVGKTPCTQTSAYPVLPGSGMVAQNGDLGVSGYVQQAGANGSIGYVEYSYALETGFPVAKMLNAAGYYTEPTPGHVAVSLLAAKINNNRNDPNVYLTQDLSGVYTNADPRTYPLSSYSYLILPTAADDKTMANTNKGLTLGDFGKYLLCEGQNQVDALGYSALPINLVQAGFDQLRKIPGAAIGTIDVSHCNNPTFSTNGTNTLAQKDPFPQTCDKRGPTQCVTGTGGAANQNTAVSPSAQGSGGAGTGGGAAGSGGTAAAAAAAAASAQQQAACDPDAGSCTTNGTALDNTNGQQIGGVPLASAAGLGDGLQVTLMIVAALLLLGLGLAPPLISQAFARRRQRQGVTR
jgi:phosphate ABC transporter phosphate-binding protein